MITIRDTDGNPTEVFAARKNRMVDILVRAQNVTQWEAVAQAQGIMVESEDEDGNPILVPAPGYSIDVLGSVVITPGEYDGEGNELAAPEYDDRHHVNIRISGPGLRSRWAEMLVQWSQDGRPDNPSATNANERTQVRSGVAFIDPASIFTPSRVWFD